VHVLHCTGDVHRRRAHRPAVHNDFRQLEVAAVADDAVVVLSGLLRVLRRERVERVEVCARRRARHRRHEIG